MNCPICKAARHQVYACWPKFKVQKCSACGFRFIDTDAGDYPKDAQFVYDEPDDLKINPDQPHLRRRVEDILRFRRPPGRALDIGCGKGEVSLLLARCGFECTAIDMKERLIRHLQQYYPSVAWRCALTEELEGEGKHYDVITLYHVLEHVREPVTCLKNLKLLANPGALIVVEVPNVGGLEARVKGKGWHYYKVDHVNYFRAGDLRRAAELAGLKVLGLKGYQHFSYPQDVLWKDLIKGTLACFGFRDVMSLFAKV